LSLAAVDVPRHMQGIPFLGRAMGDPRRYIFGARDRADDMFELSRLVHDGRHVYVRNFLPHLPQIQPGKICSSEEKAGYAALRAARAAGGLNAAQERMFAPTKPIEELYDLQSDPHEINNLAGRPDLRPVLERMRTELRLWVMRTRDTGFLTESEYARRAGMLGTTIYEMAQTSRHYDLEGIFAAADRVGRDAGPVFSPASTDSGIRYWQVIGARAVDGRFVESPSGESSPSVAIAAAELRAMADGEGAVETLAEYLGHPDPRVQLEAARALQLIGERAKPAVARMRDYVVSHSRVEDGRRKYRDFNYTSFTGWALEWALKNCGLDPESL
jgi:N-sulfoglucosamine sulfohydrolase